MTLEEKRKVLSTKFGMYFFLHSILTTCMFFIFNWIEHTYLLIGYVSITIIFLFIFFKYKLKLDQSN